MPSRERFPRKSIHYGWYILASSFFIVFFNAGARFSIGVMFKPIISEFGWSRASISLAVLLNMTVFALGLTFVGRFYDRYGPKWVIIISTLFLSAGYAGIALINSLWQLLLFYGVLSAIGLGGTGLTLFSAIMSKWFVRRRGLAISLSISGNSLGQFALMPLFTFFVLHYGWRASHVFIGCIMLLVNIILSLWVIKGDPDDLGLKPYGHAKTEKGSSLEDPEKGGSGQKDMGLRDAMGTYSFWLFLIVMFVCGCGDFVVTTHLIPMVTDYGVSPTTAGNLLAWYGLMSLAGVLIAGPVADIIGNKIPIAATFLIRIILFLIVLKYQNLFSFYVFALTFGFTHLITAPLTPILSGKLYGFAHVGILTGFITTVHHLGGGLWAYLGGVIFDHTGSYQWVFIISAVMAFVAFLCGMLIKEKRH